MKSSFLTNHCSDIRSSFNTPLKRKRNICSSEYDETKRRRIAGVINDENICCETYDQVNYVPFPNQAKINGVIIEEILEDELVDNKESTQMSIDEFHEVILAPELIKYLDNYPLQMLRNKNTDNRALVLYKPIQSIYQEKTDLNVKFIDDLSFNLKQPINESMEECKDVEME